MIITLMRKQWWWKLRMQKPMDIWQAKVFKTKYIASSRQYWSVNIVEIGVKWMSFHKCRFNFSVSIILNNLSTDQVCPPVLMRPTLLGQMIQIEMEPKITRPRGWSCEDGDIVRLSRWLRASYKFPEVQINATFIFAVRNWIFEIMVKIKIDFNDVWEGSPGG